MKKIDHRVATAGMFVFVSSSHIYYFTTSSSSVTHIHTRTHARTHARTHLNTHTYTHTHTHTCIHFLVFSPSPLPSLPPQRRVGVGEEGVARARKVSLLVTMTHCVFEHRQQVVQCGWSYKSWSRSLGRPDQNDEASENSTWQSRRARMLKSSLSRYD